MYIDDLMKTIFKGQKISNDIFRHATSPNDRRKIVGKIYADSTSGLMLWSISHSFLGEVTL